MGGLAQLLRWTLIVVAAAAAALTPVLILHLVILASTPSGPPPATKAVHNQSASYGLPMRLKIPSLNVDTALDRVGITPEGDLESPTGPVNAGWYDRGPRPGEIGNAVIDGHFGYRDHIPAVFDHLSTLQKGDELFVKDIKGLTITFVVRELRTYGPDEYAPAVFRSSDGKAHLNLITCEGTWNQAQKSFSNRLVVFADKKT